MQETPIQFLGWEDPLETGKATHSNILAWVAKSQTRLSDFHFHFQYSIDDLIRKVNLEKLFLFSHLSII